MKISETFGSRHEVGGNQPNSLEALQDRTKELIANANRWLEERPVLENQHDADKCKDFLDQLRAEIKAVDKERYAEKKPHTDAGKAVDAKYNPLKGMLETAGKLLNPIMTVWLAKQQTIQDEIAREAEAKAVAKAQAEQDAIQAAERGVTVENLIQVERAAQEAGIAAIDALRASKARASTKGQYGGKAMSLRVHKEVVITELALVFQHFSKREEVYNLLLRLAAAEVRAGNKVPGIKINETKQAV